MLINENEMISITDANKNFSKVVKILEKEDKVIILKNNRPVYVITRYDGYKKMEDNELINTALKILLEHKKVFEELGKN